ncbi:urea carboxylase [Stachybotrys elegans]|uniref:Urea carboxylase n=1 Tax=Stachybotrys elegans TaxID=80388 RepID=A0A8K0T2Z0_9HYPO|nr:urea carboxylase [Stachybotrys elegans]
MSSSNEDPIQVHNVLPLTIPEWVEANLVGQGLERLLSLLDTERNTKSNAWIALADQDDIRQQWEAVVAAKNNGAPLPLFGVPFAAKDNIDAVGFPTTAACPAFPDGPATADATVIARLKAAGAILIGKTNLDQFATGLVGTRSPHGAVPNSFDPQRVSGGSSSGSAVVVARGTVPFSLGTDTAGSGRVPAGLNNIVGLKPTRGAISTAGVLPACRTLDCVSIFALTISDAHQVLSIAEGYDSADPYSRPRPLPTLLPEPTLPPSSLTFAICKDPEWFGNAERKAAYEAALTSVRAAGVTLEPVDFSDLFELASLLYEGPWVAERYAAIRSFIEKSSAEMDPTVRGIILKAQNFSAADLFEAQYRRQRLTEKISQEYARFHAVLVPTAPTFPLLQDVARDPVGQNSLLGTYTNFVNFMDWSALSIPTDLCPKGLPFGVTLISTAWQESKLIALAKLIRPAIKRRLGATSALYQESEGKVSRLTDNNPLAQTVPIAVVGAHLRGFPLNKDLISRGAAFLEATKTAPHYRLFALASEGGAVRKPGLQRAGQHLAGESIEVEVWQLPTSEFASFFSTIPSPLGLGSVELVSGAWVCGFICEPVGLETAVDITHYGGWRRYMAAESPQKSAAQAESCLPAPESSPRPVKSVLIANRGEIAVRIIQTLQQMGIKSIAIYSTLDAAAEHVRIADIAFPLTGKTVGETYLSASQILDIAKKAGADAVIPGYGFLAENAAFASQVEASGLTWIGPTPEQMRDMGLKHRARNIAQAAGVPTVPGTALLSDSSQAVAEAQKIGFPVIVKSTAGGGGIGLRVSPNAESLKEDYESVQRLATSNFGDSGVFLERFVERARHIEVQILGDGKGSVVAVGERDCSLQRRNQKVVEECPASFVPREVRQKMRKAAIDLATAVNYRNVGTVEFIYDIDRADFFFLEMNTRLQVEHPVTEEMMGLDLVQWMVQIAGDEGDIRELQLRDSDDKFSIEVRLYAESPLQNFRPSSGKLIDVKFPTEVRVDTWVRPGTELSSSYDPLIAKIIATGSSRSEAISKLKEGLQSTSITGVETNLEYLAEIIVSEEFQSGEFTTKTLDTFHHQTAAIEVLEPGPGTTVQSCAGRIGYWQVGIPPSGPLDSYSLGLANRLVGNHVSAAGLECTLQGPTLLFHCDSLVAVAGAVADVTVDGRIVDSTKTIHIRKGESLSVGQSSSGCRSYIAFQGGLRVPEVLGSRSTFPLGQFGGHNGRALQCGDLLRLEHHSSESTTPSSAILPRLPIPSGDEPQWQIAVMPGPHGSPDFFTPESYARLFTEYWTVHYNSNRSGIRLKGPKPSWARADGGSAGLHPSNIHDSPYTIGSISFTGDEAVVLTGDGPSLGGFVVFATVITADMWKFGQMRAGDRIQLVPVRRSWALDQSVALSRAVEDLSVPAVQSLSDLSSTAAQDYLSAEMVALADGEDAVLCRPFGDRALLLEFGQHDGFNLRQTFRIVAIIQQHETSPIPKVEELVPGVRTLLVLYGACLNHREAIEDLRQRVEAVKHGLPSVLPSRRVRLPFAFDDRVSQAAVDRYIATIRSTAPYLPNNVEFLRQLNFPNCGPEAVQQTLEGGDFLVLGLGDVYLGSPCAVPLDPRNRLFGTKYNPSRSYTPRNSVGIGGQYMCIYATDSPGGYQLVGRTTPIWDAGRIAGGSGEPAWAFRLIDRISFYAVSEEALDNAIASGTWHDLMSYEEDTLNLDEYEGWLVERSKEIQGALQRQVQAVQNAPFYGELMKPYEAKPDSAAPGPRADDFPDAEKVKANIPGRCFRVEVKEGQDVEVGDVLAWIEANKMEMKIQSPVRGRCVKVCATAGSIVDAMDDLFIIAPS